MSALHRPPGGDVSVRVPVAAVRSDPLLAHATQALKQGLMLFDATGALIAVNEAARRALERRPEIELFALAESPDAPMRLHLKRAALHLKLERAVRVCASAPGRLAGGSAGIERRAQALILTFERGQPGLILHLSPLVAPEDGSVEAGQPAVLGVLIDRGREPRLEPAVLRELFGLTEAEARVAEAYLTRDTVKDVARTIGISANTVKKHLSAVYLKTGCSRQAQLVRLLMSLAELHDDRQEPSGSGQGLARRRLG